MASLGSMLILLLSLHFKIHIQRAFVQDWECASEEEHMLDIDKAQDSMLNNDKNKMCKSHTVT